MKQILIVEDDELLNKMLVYNLQSELTEHTLANEIEAPHEILRK